MRSQPTCPLCGGELRLSHREYLGGRRSVRVLSCVGCGSQVRGEPQDDDARPRAQPPPRRRPLPEGGQPDNFVIDDATAERLRQMLEGGTAGPEA